MRRNDSKSYGNPTMGRNVTMDRRLRKRLRDLPTKQAHDPQKENTPLPHYYQRRDPSIPANRNGPYHGITATTRTQCHTNHRRPWMLPRSHLPTMFGHHYRPRNCATLSGLRLLMVRPTDQNDQRP